MYTHSVDTLSKSLNLDNISKQWVLKRTSVEIENQQFSSLSKMYVSSKYFIIV